MRRKMAVPATNCFRSRGLAVQATARAARTVGFAYFVPWDCKSFTSGAKTNPL
jgi:hypothetical protein